MTPLFFLFEGEVGFFGFRALSLSSILASYGVLEMSLLAIYCILWRAVDFFYDISYIIQIETLTKMIENKIL